jgi:hypothetical protein
VSDEPEEEIDIAAAFGAEPLHGQRFAVFIPNKDRDGQPVEQPRWVMEALTLLAQVGGGATAMPPVTGAWLNPDTAALVIEEPVVVFSYVRPARFVEMLPQLVTFVKRLGRETNQGAIAIEFDGRFFTVVDFS